MNQETLNNLKIGEKAADIQEYFHGKNGKTLTYKVTIYECIEKRICFIFNRKEIKTYSIPFFFKTKELAEEFLTQCGNFNIVYSKILIDGLYMYAFILEPRNISNVKNRYILIDEHKHSMLGECAIINKNGTAIWNGYVNYGSYSLKKNYTIRYNEIFNIEELAAKEGTTGNIFSYKLSEIM